jgi:hypothetical protein
MNATFVPPDELIAHDEEGEFEVRVKALAIALLATFTTTIP